MNLSYFVGTKSNTCVWGWFTALRDEPWLLIQWPEEESAPSRYWLSNLPQSATAEHLIYTAKMRWHIERDYQELKDELGLNHTMKGVTGEDFTITPPFV